MSAAPLLFSVVLGLWWGRVVLTLGLAAGLGLPLAAVLALAALASAATAGRRFVLRGAEGAIRVSRGFLALGLSFGLGALPLAAAAMWVGETAGAKAAEGANPLGPVFGTVLAPILAGNLVAGLMVALAAFAALACLVLAAAFGLSARRQ